MLPATRLISLAFVVCLLAGLGTAAAVEPRRVALVIGNSRYEHVQELTNPANDARLIGEVLRQLGFDMVGGGPQLDLNRERMARAIREFSAKIGPGTVSVFYYAGHGIQIRGENFLIPVAADLHNANDVDFELVNLGVVLRQMELRESTLNLVILDACRNNPFADRLLADGGAGLAQMRSPRGTVIAFATQPGDVAQDGRGRDSPFSIALSQEMPKPNVSLLDMFNNVSSDVNASTNKLQLPWVSSSAVDETFYLGGDLARFAGRSTPAGATVGPPGASGKKGADKKTAELIMSPPPGFLSLPSGQGPPAPPQAEREVASGQPAAAPAAQQPPGSSEVLLWENVQYSRDIPELEAYLKQFPTGVFSGLARIRIDELKNVASNQPGVTAPPKPQPVACKVESRETGAVSLEAEHHYKVTLSAAGPPCPIVHNGVMFSNYSVGDEPRHGSVAIQLSDLGFVVRVIYTPEQGFTGEDDFSYRLLPGNGRRRVAVTVGP
jgi:hypothetical protein